MPFARPTPQQLRDRLAADLEAALPGADARTRRTVEGVLVRAVAGAAYDLYGYLDWMSQQIHVTSCDDDLLLDRHASLWGLARVPAAAASGAIAVTGAAGAVLPAGIELRRSDDARYATVADVTLDGTGAGAGRVTASAAGAAGDAAIGTTLQLVTPVAGIATSVTVADDGSGQGLSGGADLESTGSLRARILERVQQPPHGGAAFDYHAWTLAVPGVTRAWVLPLWLGPGTVGVTFCVDGASYGPAPSSIDVAAVQAALDAVRPVTAACTVFAPTLDAIAFTIGVQPNTAAVQAAVTAALADFFRREAAPGGTIYLSRLSAEIAAVNGEYRHKLVAPAADIVAAPGHLAVPGAITWTVYP